MSATVVTGAPVEDEGVIRARALSLADYLLAVRALVEKPSRTVPATEAYWQDDLPAHPACELGPRTPGGSWLRVGRPSPPAPPQIPTGLLRHLVWDLSATTEPTLMPEAGPRVREEFDSWHAQQWLPWSREDAAAQATRRLHDRLYDLRYRLDVDAARVELVWGHAVLDATVAGERVHYPLLVTPVTVEYDADATAVTVSPQGPARLAVDALSDLDNRRVADLLALGGPRGQVELDPWEAGERQEFARRALRRLGLDPVLRLTPGEPVSGPHVHDTGAFFVRPRQRMVRRFLEQLRERLDTDPDASVGALASVLAHEPSRLRLPDDDPGAWTATGARLLMPMATNEAQESIARRLATHRSVAVQGPPGTGKTHTIRNLICHLVAHGKRVLVLAQKEDPLRVLRDGLPESLQPLCLAVLGRSADQLVQLQIAARELSDRAATLDREGEAIEVRRLAAELDRAAADFDDAREQLRAAAQREAEVYPLESVEAPATASEVGEWLRRHEADGLIPDPVPPGTPPPLAVDEFAVLCDLARRIPAGDRAAALGPLPTQDQLPSGEALAARRAALRDARKVVEALRDRGVAVDGVRGLGAEPVEELAVRLRTAADDLTRREGSWTDRLGRLVHDPSWRAVWDANVTACQGLLTELGRRTAFVAGRRVSVPERYAAQPRRLLAQLADVRARLAAGRRIGRLTHAELARLAAECQVDGEPLRSAADVDLVVATVERGQLRGQLAARWAEWRTRLDAPVPGAATGDDVGEPELWAGRLLTDAVDALEWERRRWPELYAVVVRVQPACPRAVDARQLAELAGAVEAAGSVFVADQLAAQRAALADWLHRVAADPAAAPVLRRLAVAWEADDAAGWDAAVAEVRRLWALRPDAERFVALHARLAAVTPAWAASGSMPVDGDAALRAWRWRQAQTWFDETIAAVDTVALGRRVERTRDRIQRLTGELVVASAWLEVALVLDDRRRAALADWTAALRKIGKGTGRSAAHWQAAAQRAMAEAVTAVPVWIMSIDRALEQFSAGEQIFDVVVVDEASQADLFALPALTLARRAVVVGDDQQIGPQLVGVPVDKVNALISTHLREVPSAPHFDTESSLYDHAVRRSPERILLTEHFRCVPSIISFSSDTYYDGRVQPLRADRPAGLGAAVTTVHVDQGRRITLPEFGEVNVAEAEALVARVEAMVADPAYAGRTIGVVSLLSTSGQAAYLHHRLRDQLGADELERRALRVGDPYTFQGDERDVVLISMVVSAADGTLGAFTKRDFHRRINVAASRARDQMWLFHSVTPMDLHPDDARALLLAYAQKPPVFDEPTGPAEDRCEDDFQRAVLRRLTARGLRPVPQFRIGSYRIDFLLATPGGRRLAIECDGDRYGGAGAFARDLRRQAVLERVGRCSFVRVRASRFARDPEQALAPVWQRAEELGLVLRPS